jgi:archaellum component FlaG (FlaF/FlaG flagellin family)
VSERKLSDDGKWEWDGTQWTPYDAEDNKSNVETPYSPLLGTQDENKGENQNQSVRFDTPAHKIVPSEDSGPLEKDKSQDKMLTILAISVLIFSSITGILAQKFTEIEEQASTHEAKALEFTSQARAEESLENQVLLREEILLTEIKSLILQSQLQEDEQSRLQATLDGELFNYTHQLDVYELMDWAYNRIYFPELLLMCEPEHCESEATDPGYDTDLEFMTYSFTLGHDDDLDARLRNVQFEFELNDRDHEISVSELSGEIHITIPSYTVPAQPEYGIDEYSVGMDGYVSELEWDIELEKWNQSSLEIDVSFARENRAIFSENAALNFQAAEAAYTNYVISINDGFEDAAWDYLDMYNQSLAAYTESSEIAENYTDQFANYELELNNAKNRIQYLEQEINYIMEGNQELQLDKRFQGLETIADRYFAAERAFLSGENAITKTDDLVSRLFNQSDAYNASVIDTATGEYTTEGVQLSYYSALHGPSSETYNSSKQEQDNASEIRAQLSELSTAVMFVSVGNVILGVTGGMVTKAKQGKGNKRNIMILLAAGALTGSVGALQSVGFIL